MWATIGKLATIFILGKLSWSVLKGIYGSFLASALGLNTNFKSLGKWAVVTGATDGIGKAYAHELARRGLNLVLISRTPFKLQNVAAELHTKYGVETKIIDVDFTKTDIYDRIEKELTKLEIGVLVNNVGISYEYPDYVVNLPTEIMDSMINCNVVAVTKMSRIVLPGMQERKRGLIINISSYSCLIPAPFLAIYGATKAYMSNFSENLRVEMKPHGIAVQCITPAFVATNMSKLRRATLMAPSPTAFVKSALKTTGVEDFTAGYFMHKLQVYVTEIAKNFLPGFILAKVVYNDLMRLRVKAIAKKQRTEKSQ